MRIPSRNLGIFLLVFGKYFGMILQDRQGVRSCKNKAKPLLSINKCSLNLPMFLQTFSNFIRKFSRFPRVR